MTKIIDFVQEAAMRGNSRPLDYMIKLAEDEAMSAYDRNIQKYCANTVNTDDLMKQLSDVHVLAGFRSRREYFWHLSQTYKMDVNMIQHWALELGVEHDFTTLVEKVHRNAHQTDIDPWHV